MKTDNIRSILESLLTCYSARAVGHTYAMMNGAVSQTSIVLVSSQRHKEQLQRGCVENNIEFVTLNDVANRKLVGFRKPLLIDHAVLVDIFWRAYREIARLDSEMATLILNKQGKPVDGG